MIELVDCISCVSLEEEQARIAQLDCLMAGAYRRHLLRVERKFLVGGGEEFHRIRVAAGEQNAVVGKQSGGVTDSRRGHGQKRGRKRFCRWIKYFRRASVVTAGDENFAIIEERSGVPCPCRPHGGR